VAYEDGQNPAKDYLAIAKEKGTEDVKYLMIRKVIIGHYGLGCTS